MNDTPLKPAEFFINAVSPDPQPPESENYVIKTRLNGGRWASAMGATGIHEVRSFLQGQANEDVINKKKPQSLSARSRQSRVIRFRASQLNEWLAKLAG
jgi:hypothetical protein